MRVLLQRVSSASVVIAEEIVSRIGHGLLLFVGFGREDGKQLLGSMTDKVVNLRVFPDLAGRMNRSLLQVGGDVLVIPQFTLYADVERGRRPEFSRAMPPEPAEELFADFVDFLRTAGVARVGQGRFGASMQVQLVNEGPVTLLLEK